MSLILEALKKSESRRRLGEAPDLGTPFTVKPRRRNPWPLIVIAIAVAGGVGWWYAGTMAVAPSKDANTVVALPAPPIVKSPSNAPQTGTQAAKAGLGTARESTSAPVSPKVDGSAPAMTAKPPARAESGAAAAGGGGDSRVPRPINQHLSLSAAQSPVNPGAPDAPAQAPASRAPPISRATPPTPTPVAAVPPTASGEPAAAGLAQQTNVATAQPNSAAPKPVEPAPATPAAPAAPVAPAAPAVTQYYELAYSVRKDIPQFNLSMHVFAADPAARFIVVDGERKVEGDAVKEGLVLREVRTDGIVLEFRGQRFFYPRPGH